MPYDGGLDLYLRWDANASYEGFNSCFAKCGRAERSRGPLRRAAARSRRSVLCAVGAARVEDDSVVVTDRNRGPRDPARAAAMMSNRADAQITTIKAGHLSLITHPAPVTKVILSAVDATT